MDWNIQDTIVAPATAPGTAAVAIVRLAGPQAWTLAGHVFPALGATSTPRMAVFGRLETPDGVVDEALVLPFRGPRSYTGDDLVEFHLHGNDLLVSGLVRSLVSLGARPAGPGEFTRRAFLNGKLDLTRAEAVAEVIAARSERAARGAAARLAGALSDRYRGIRTRLLDLLVHLEASVDFPDEDIETLGYPRLLGDLAALQAELQGLAATYTSGRIERDGLRVGIAGRPNAGKSSLLNALLGSERAIVTPVAGTTRDYLEESLTVAGARIQIIDTAGLRETDDVVEAEGIRRARGRMAEADLLLYVVDMTCPPVSGEWEAARDLGRGTLVWVLNKADLAEGPFPEPPGGPVFRLSARTGAGVDALLGWLGSAAAGSDGDQGFRVATARQARLLEQSAASLAAARDALTSGISPDLVVQDLRDAVRTVGELTGEIANDEVLGSIFSTFCVGK